MAFFSSPSKGLSHSALLGWPGILALFVLLLDQLSKLLIYRLWPEPGSGDFWIIPGFFRIVHWRNLGAAWGLFANHTWLLALVSLTALVALVIAFNFLSEGKPCIAMPLGMLLGGIAGNMVDRFFYKDGVIDFIRFEFWPAFNIADSAICCSVFLLIVVNLLLTKKTKNADDDK